MIRTFVIMALASASCVFSQSIHITGVVVDSGTLQPIANAKVELAGVPAISSLSNDSGQFVLEGTTATNQNQTLAPSPYGIAISGNNLVLSGAKNDGPAILSVFNSAGSRLYFAKKQVRLGATTVFSGLWRTAGVYFIRIQSDNNAQSFKICPAAQYNASSIPVRSTATGKSAKTTAACVIEISKAGYFAKHVTAGNERSDVGVEKLTAIPATVNYIPMSIGDFRQFVQSLDSSTIQIEITGTALRRDGKAVFVQTYQAGNLTPDTSYCYDDGQFLVSCNSLDSAKDSSGNKITIDPFGEQRLALKAPVENQAWYQFKEDTSSIYRISKSYGALETALGPFQNVFGFEMYGSKADSLPFMTVCFAKNIGWITTLSGNNADSVTAMPVYIHTATMEKGVMVPKQDGKVSLSKAALSGARRKVISMQGAFLHSIAFAK
jgi:hypothetical protein